MKNHSKLWILFLTALLALGLFVCAAQAEKFTVIKNGKATEIEADTQITSATETLPGGTYYVNSTFSHDGPLTIIGSSTIILCDGCNASYAGGIQLKAGNGQTVNVEIVSQAGQTGKLSGTVTGSDTAAGIGPAADSVGYTSLTIHSGTVTGKAEYGAGIGYAQNEADRFSLSICGGTVTGTSTEGAGIGLGEFTTSYQWGGSISISGGTVKGTSTNGAGIGAGHKACCVGSIKFFGSSDPSTDDGRRIDLNLTASSTNGDAIGNGWASPGEGIPPAAIKSKIFATKYVTVMIGNSAGDAKAIDHDMKKDLGSDCIDKKYASIEPGNLVPVHFNLQGHGGTVDDIDVEINSTIPTTKRPSDPTETGYLFLGWYKDAECTTPWNFETDKVTENETTLYAEWFSLTGDCGENLKYVLSSEDQNKTFKLSIKGTGTTMTTWAEDGTDVPWKRIAERITELDFTEATALENISRNSFLDCVNLVKAPLPASLQTIGEKAFSGCSALSEVTFPEDSKLSSIGTEAFSNCSSILSITLPASLQTIGEKAFSGCSALREVAFPEDSKLSSIGSVAFYNCSSIPSIALPASLQYIEQSAFMCCSALSEVTFPEDSKLIAIGAYAFYDCKSISSITLPASLQRINTAAFHFCDKLERITFMDPANLGRIWGQAFEGCGMLCEVWDGSVTPAERFTDALADLMNKTVTEGNDYLLDCLCSKVIGNNLSYYLTKNVDGVNYTLTITGHGEMMDMEEGKQPWAWANERITAVEFLPDEEGGITAIGNYAFSNLTVLKEIDLPDTLERINEAAFMGSGIEKLYIPDSVSTIESQAFQICNNLKEVRLPANEKYTEIASCLFNACSALTQIEIPDTVEKIGDRAFAMTGLVSVCIPDSVSEIGSSAFELCTSLKEAVLPNNAKYTTVEDNLFSNACSLEKVTIPATVETIEYGAFTSCTSLKQINIPASVKTIGGCAFYECSNLRVLIEKGTALAGEDAVIESSAFGDSASGFTFHYDGSDDDAAIRANASTEGNDDFRDPSKWYASSTGYCGKVTEEYPNGENLSYLYYNNGTLDGQGYSLIITGEGPMADYHSIFATDKDLAPWIVPSSENPQEPKYQFTELVLPEGLTEIGNSAFTACTLRLAKVKIPDAVTRIGYGAFNLAGKDTSGFEVVFSENSSLEKIEYAAFYGCTNLRTISLPKTVKKIAAQAFGLCYNLNSIKLNAAGIETIAQKAFDSCNSLTTVTDYEGDENALALLRLRTAVTGNDKFLAKLPQGGSCGETLQWCYTVNTDQKTYTLHIGGTGAMDDYDLEDNTAPWLEAIEAKDITALDFSACTGATIGSYAFSNCISLTELTLPEGITSVGDYAFYCCSNLEDVNFSGSKLTTIGDYAFADTVITSLKLPEGLTGVGEYSFNNILNMTELELPSTLTYIGAYAFDGANNSSILNIYLPASSKLGETENKRIAEYAFKVNALKVFFGGTAKQRDAILSNTMHDGNTLLLDTNNWIIDTIMTGSCGTNMTYAVIKESDDSNVLMLSGYGDMTNYAKNAAPWSSVNITKVIFNGDAANGGITGIGDYAFAGQQITSLVFPDTVSKLGKSVCCYCQDLLSVKLPNNANFTEIPECAFKNCEHLAEITIPASVTKLGKEVFYKCYDVKSVTFLSNDTLTEIGESAFEECTSLKAISFPDSVTKLGKNVCKKCNWLESVKLPNNEKFTEVPEGAFSKCDLFLTSITFPDSVTKLGKNVCENCDKLASVKLPDNPAFTVIPENAFFGCNGLTQITIPASVEEIQADAFTSVCPPERSAVLTITFEDASAIKKICKAAFDSNLGCKSGKLNLVDNRTGALPVMLLDVVDPYRNDCLLYLLNKTDPRKCGENLSWELSDDNRTLTITGYGEMYDYTPDDTLRNTPWKDHDASITSIVFKEDGGFITSIGSGAFRNFISLSEVKIPKNVTEIGYGAFNGCKELASVNLQELTKLEIIGADAFDGCGIKEVELPASVSKILKNAFMSCPIEKFVLPQNSMLLQGEEINIEEHAFFLVTNMKVYYTEEGTARTAQGATTFNAFMARTDRTSSSNFIDLNYWIATSGNCGDNLSWEMKANEEPAGTYTLVLSGSGDMQNWKAESECPWYPYISKINAVDFSACDGLTSIGSYAFSTTAITRIEIPDSVSTIGEKAFNACNSLSEVILPNNAAFTKIEGYVFANCASLGTIVIPDSVTGIDGGVFANCPKLKNITLSKNLKTIGESAFCDCTSLQSIILPEGLTSIDQEAFKRCYSLKNITLPNGLTTIGYEAFSSCDSLESITLPESLETIGESAFCDCTSLQSISLSEGIKTIGGGCFKCCDNLTEVHIPASVSSINGYAFSTISSKNLNIYLASGTKLAQGKETQINIEQYAFENRNVKVYYYETTSDNAVRTAIIAHTDDKGNSSFKTVSNWTAVKGIFGVEGTLTWELMDNTLYIAGSGAMPDWESSEETPWAKLKSEIKAVDFSGCENLTYIGARAFNCYGTLAGNVTIPDTVTGIGEYAFSNTSISSIKLPDNPAFTRIKEDAFSLSALESVEIPASVKIIEHTAFYGCSKLKTVKMNEGLETIDYSAFVYCNKLTSVTLPESLKTIGFKAFYGTTALNLINIPAGVETIGAYAFACDNAASLTLYILQGSKLKTIGEYAFNKRTTFKVSYFEETANFSKELATRKALIATADPDGNDNFVDTANWQPYGGYCGSEGDNISWYVVGNSLVFTGSGELVAGDKTSYPWDSQRGGISTVDLTGVTGLTVISTKAFMEMPELTKVYLPDTIKSILNAAFYNCEKLINFTLPASVQFIDRFVFGTQNAAALELTLEHGTQLATAYSSGYNVGNNNFKNRNVTVYHSEDEATAAAIRSTEHTSETGNTSFINKDNWKYMGSTLTGKCGDNLTYVLTPNADGSYALTITGHGPMTDYWDGEGNPWAEVSVSSVSFVDDAKGGITTIGAYAFSLQTKLATIAIPDSVTSMNESAFEYSGLQSITFGKDSKLTTIGDFVFTRCTNLASIAIPDSVTAFGDYVFNNCSGLQSITFGKNSKLTYLCSFEGCSSLTSIAVPDGVTFISSNAFNGTALQSITFGKDSKLTTIEMRAFEGLTTLTSIAIPDSVTEIEANAFNGSGLQSITFGTGSKLTTIGESAFSNCTSLSSIAIPDSVTTLGSNAFKKSGLQSVTFGKDSKLTNMGSSAFYQCQKLTAIAIPDGVTELDSTFNWCTALKSVTFGKNSKLTTLNTSAFVDCSSLESIELPATVTTIGKYCFERDYALKSVTFGENSALTTISENAFANCRALESITIPSGVTSIGEQAFTSDINLKTVTFGKDSKLATIGSKAFYGCSVLETITIPDTVKTLCDNAFANCTELRSVTFGKDSALAGELSSCAFSGCKALETISIPDGISTIGMRTFENCTALKSVSFGENSQLEVIRGMAFIGCTSLKTITLSAATLKEIYEDAFKNCSALAEIKDAGGDMDAVYMLSVTCIIADGNDYFERLLPKVEPTGDLHWYILSNEDMDGKGKTLVINGNGDMGEYGYSWTEKFAPWYQDRELITRVRFVGAPTSIGHDAFKFLTKLLSVEIPGTVQRIDYNAFQGCTSLKSVTLKKGETDSTICGNAFEDCTALESLTIASNWKTIYSLAFINCENLTTITLDAAAISYIGKNAFANCTGLANEGAAVIDVNNDIDALGRLHSKTGAEGNTAFLNLLPKGGQFGESEVYYYIKETHEGKTLIVYGKGDIPDFKIGKIPYLNDFATIDEIVIEEGVTGIGNDAFGAMNTSFDTVYTSVTKLTLPTSLTKIGEYAFRDQNKLESVTIPANVTELGDGAFDSNAALKTVSFAEGSKLESIGEVTFTGSGIESFKLPDSVTSIGAGAFMNCKSLKKLSISKNTSLKSIQLDFFYSCENAYVDCECSIATITKALANPEDISYFVFHAGEDITIKATGEGEYVIVAEKGVTELSGMAEVFDGVGVTGITIPEGIETIAADCFKGMKSLKRIVLPTTLKKVGKDAFDGCSNIVSVNYDGTIQGYDSDWSKIDIHSEGNNAILIPQIIYIAQVNKDGSVAKFVQEDSRELYLNKSEEYNQTQVYVQIWPSNVDMSNIKVDISSELEDCIEIDEKSAYIGQSTMSFTVKAKKATASEGKISIVSKNSENVKAVLKLKVNNIKAKLDGFLYDTEEVYISGDKQLPETFTATAVLTDHTANNLKSKFEVVSLDDSLSFTSVSGLDEEGRETLAVRFTGTGRAKLRYTVNGQVNESNVITVKSYTPTTAMSITGVPESDVVLEKQSDGSYKAVVTLDQSITPADATFKDKVNYYTDVISGTDFIFSPDGTKLIITAEGCGTLSVKLKNDFEGIESETVTIKFVKRAEKILLTDPQIENLPVKDYTDPDETRIPLTVSIEPADTTNKKIKWYSSDDSIAAVEKTESGSYELVLKQPGEVTIYGKTADGSELRTKIITVSSYQVIDKIKLYADPADPVLYEGEPVTFTVKAWINPTTAETEDYGNVKFSYAVNNRGEDTVITAKQNGKTYTVTVTGGDANLTVYCVAKDAGKAEATPVNLIVYDRTLVTKIKLRSNINPVPYEGSGDTKVQLTAEVTPEFADNKSVSYSSSNTDIATVSSTGLVTFYSRGIVTITATAKDGSGVTGSIKLRCGDASLTKLALTADSTTVTLKSGKATVKTQLSYTPSATIYRNVKYYSSDKSIATVDENGVVTFTKAGTVTITVKSTDVDNVKATLKLTAKNASTKVSFFKIKNMTNSSYLKLADSAKAANVALALKKGEKVKLVCTSYKPTAPSSYKVIFKILDGSECIKLVKSGVSNNMAYVQYQGIKAGTVLIKVYPSSNKDYVRYFKIKVK